MFDSKLCIEESSGFPGSLPIFPSTKLAASDKQQAAAWLPYYAGYSQDFVRAAIDSLGLLKGSLVLDPWAGSGTTSLVCRAKQVSSLAVEINPVVAHFATARLNAPEVSAKQRSSLEKTLRSCFVNKEASTCGLGDPISLAVSAIQRLRYFEKEFLTQDQETLGLKRSARALNPTFSILLSSILSAARSTSKVSVGSNPTWPQLPTEKVSIESVELYEQAGARLAEMLSVSDSNKTEGKVIQLVGNSSTIPVRKNVFDAIITSPPYLTRIDYVMSMLPELICYFGTSEISELRRNSMGTPMIRKCIPEASKEWGGLCLDTLSAVRTHGSYAAQSYYFKTMVQYFADASASLGEIRRTLKPRGIALLVVQNSYFKDIELPLGEIYVDMAKNLFRGAEIISRLPVNVSLSNINSKSRKHQDTKRLYEDVIAIYK